MQSSQSFFSQLSHSPRLHGVRIAPMVLMMLIVSLSGCWNRTNSSASSAGTKEVDSSMETGEQSTALKDNSLPNASKIDDETTIGASSSTAESDITVTDSATGDISAIENASAENANSAATEMMPQGSWTVQRLIAPNPGGPLVLDFRVQVGGQDLEAAGAKVLEPIVASVLAELSQENTWPKLLEIPLVKSGWLGNLSGDTDAVAQISDMYDRNKDQAVQAEELTEFLTRGLSRSAALQVADIGSEPNSGSDNSKFGMLDRDNDNVLSLEELESGAEQLMKLDFNGDSMITLAELSNNNNSSEMAMAGQRSSSMLRATTVLFEPLSAASEPEAVRKKARQRKVNELLEQYSFLGQIEREQWPDWDQKQWSAVDVDSDGQLGKLELTSLFEQPAVVDVGLSLPNIEDETNQPRWFMQPSGHWNWSSVVTNARLCNLSICLSLEFEEGYNKRAKSILKAQLGQALKNPQLAQFIMQQLQLKEKAIELADQNQDGILQDEEFARAWQWISARQSTRLQAKWMLSARPWFQMLDLDGNQTLSEFEIRQTKKSLGNLDADKDGEISTDELPLIVKMRVSRADTRLNLPPNLQQSMESPAEAEDWFAAMDTNQDGNISRQEFLGSEASFAGADRNSDGFISKTEVY